tara:strand:+ start:525 stop:1181 length:657 start_codon:yes stop_codon:yes gene_type:complete
MAILTLINKRRVKMEGIPQPIIKVAEKYNLKLPQNKKDMSGDFWCIGNNFIIFHDALTKIAKQEGIVFHKPEVEILYNDNSFYGVAMMGEAELDGYKIWTTADSTKDNTMAKYYFNMAEKRLRDRQVLKLLDLYEYGLYSDIEADDFKKNAQSEKPMSNYHKNTIRQFLKAKEQYKKEEAEAIFKTLNLEQGAEWKDKIQSPNIDNAIIEFYKLNKGV